MKSAIYPWVKDPISKTLVYLSMPLLFGFAALISDRCFAQTQAQASDIKLVRFENHRNKLNDFLTESEIEMFRNILGRVSQRSNVPGKFAPEQMWFFYWVYDPTTNDLSRHAIAFSEDGRSINLDIDSDTSGSVVKLIACIDMRNFEKRKIGNEFGVGKSGAMSGQPDKRKNSGGERALK